MGFARVYTFHRSNALSFVRKYGLEFFQPLAAPQPTKNHVQRLRWGQVMDTARVSSPETRKQPKGTSGGAGVAREPSGTTAITEHKEPAEKEVMEPSYG